MTTDPRPPEGVTGPETAAVEEALSRLEGLDEEELADQVTTYEQIHDRLAAGIDPVPDRSRPSGTP